MSKPSPLLSIFIIILVDILGLTLIIPLLPFYAESLGASPFIVGSLVTVYALCQFLAGPVLGRLSDRIGRKPVLMLSQVGTLAGFLLLASSKSLFMVFLARIIDGLTAGNISVAQAYITDVTEPTKRSTAFGLVGIAFGVGFMIGPGISGFLAQYDFDYPIYAAAVLSAMSILTTWALLPSGKTQAAHADGAPSELTSAFAALRRPKLSPLLWQYLLFAFGFTLFFSGFALFAERRLTIHGMAFGPKEVGYVLAFMGVAGAVVQGGLIKRLVERLGEPKLLRIGFVSMIIALTILGISNHLAVLALSILLLALGTALLRPSLLSLISQTINQADQGRVMGITTSLQSVAQILAPLLSGYMIQHLLLSSWAFAGAAFSGAGLFMVLRSGRST